MNSNVIKLQLDQLDKKATALIGESFKSDTFREGIDIQISERTDDVKKLIELYDILKWCRKAVEETHSDKSEVSEDAGYVVARFAHVKSDFRQLENSARRFGKAVQELKTSEEIQREKSRQREYILESDLLLRSVGTKESLLEIGKELENCVRDEEHAKTYINKAKVGKTELWALYSPTPDENVLALIEVNCEGRTVSDFNCLRDRRDSVIDFGLIEGKNPFSKKFNYEDIKEKGVITRDDLIEILNILDVSADDEPDFVKLGAFSSFRDGIPETEPVELFDGREMWVWRFDDEIIVGLEADGINDDMAFNWSGFKRGTSFDDKVTFADASHSQHLELEELFALIIENPHVFEKFTIENKI